MIIAMIAMGMVQMPIHQIVDVVAVRNRLVTASGAVLVARRVPLAAVLGCAAIGVLRRHFDHVLVDMVAVWMVQMPVVQKIHVVAMADGRMTAAGPVLM
jgi:hypothetical protein